MLRSKRRLVLALLLSLSLVAAACGSDDDEGGEAEGGTGTTEATAEKPAGEPIKLMVLTSLTGPSVHFADVPEGAKAAAQAINAAGGVKDPAGGANRPIEIIPCDDGFDPNKAAECARKAVSEKVLALVGNVSPHGDVYGPIVYAAGIPLVGIQANGAAESLNELSFPMQGGSVVSLLSNVAFLAKQGVTKITVEHIQNAAADFLVNQMKKKAESLGVEVVNDILVPADAADVTSYAARFTANGANGAVLVEPSERTAKFITALSQAGVDFTKFKAAAALTAADLEKLGSAADGWFTGEPGFPVTDKRNPGIKQFQKEYGAIDDAPEPSVFALQAWVATHVIAELIPTAKAVDSASLIEVMKTAGPITRPEWTPFDWAKPVEAIPGLKLRSFSLKIMYSRAEGGKFTPVTDTFTQYL